jgi:subtilisin-like proprotein convertase family protein
MSLYLRKTAALVAGALVATGAPFLAASPTEAVPPTPSLGCVVNAVQTATASVPVPIAIPDTNLPLPFLPMSSAVSTLTVPTGGALSWLRVRTDIVHSNPQDLLVTLTSPIGDVITLTSGNGGASNNAFNGTWWDDQAGATNAPGSAAEATYTNGVTETPLAPEAALANLRGQDVAGVWKLTVTDRLAGGGSGAGSLTGWAIEYATRSGGAPDLHTISSGPLSGGTVPGLSSSTFQLPVGSAGPGALSDVVANLDVAGSAGSVFATLTSPAGTVVTLTKGNGGLLTSFLGGTKFADVGGLTTGPISDLVTTLLGHITLAAPQEPLTALLGQAPAGLWTLRLENLGVTPLTLNSWGLDLTSSSCGLDGGVTPLTTLPTTLPLGSTFAYAVSVTNNRLAPLDLSTLKLALPSGLDLVSVTSSLGSCAGLTCALGTLLPGAQAVVVYVLKVLTDGVKNITVTLSSLGLDALPANNILNVATTVPQGSGTTTGKDTTAPGLVMLLGKDKLGTVAKKGVLSVAGWTEGGRMVLTVKLPGKVAKKLHLPRVIGKRSLAMSRAGTAKIRVHISKKAAKKLTKAGKKVRLVVKGQLRDAAGNLGKGSASGTFKP